MTVRCTFREICYFAINMIGALHLFIFFFLSIVKYNKPFSCNADDLSRAMPLLHFKPSPSGSHYRLRPFCHSDRSNDSGRRSYIAEESDIQLNSCSLEWGHIRFLRSLLASAQSEWQPSFLLHLRNTNESLSQEFQSISKPTTKNQVIAFPLRGKGGDRGIDQLRSGGTYYIIPFNQYYWCIIRFLRSLLTSALSGWQSLFNGQLF